MKVNFLLAEEVRSEVSGKLTILGLYPGDVIVLLKGARPAGVSPDTPSGIERMVILAVITGAPEGLHKLKGRMLNPAGEAEIPEIALDDAIAKSGQSHTAIIEFKPFMINQLGIFNFELFIDDTKFTFPFEVREEN
jgi:hypothetical protein